MQKGPEHSVPGPFLDQVPLGLSGELLDPITPVVLGLIQRHIGPGH